MEFRDITLASGRSIFCRFMCLWVIILSGNVALAQCCEEPIPICPNGRVYSYEFCSCVIPQSPVILDTTGQGFRLTDAIGGVWFDIDADGKLERTAWTDAKSGNAFLVLDRNGNGRIDDGSELFGSVTPQPESGEPNGFTALGVFDLIAGGGNEDGIVDKRDAVFGSLRLWIDASHDGVASPVELHPLPELNVLAISLDYREALKRDAFGNLFRYRAKVTASTQTRVGPWAYDVFWGTEQTVLLQSQN